ncbi:MAG: family 6 glucosyltransferase [Gemmiger sp.]|uniref:family 6 glucosyltransferase n=1 Tax=Gemmiger sp. TaxID=2049027 RepID=UPI002E782225|nr:family 6 glucosyltransferase [Gemmiger sp.]MEE0799713.1 family 6 glucosyltransferase [Gemmiger sp.]
MTKIGMLYLCTGRYNVFWPDFYHSFREKFLTDCDREFFVFTDAPHIEGESDPAVHRIPQQAYDWPYSTLRRFSVFLSQEKVLRDFDYLFFFNANLVCSKPITSQEFLPRPALGENLLLVQQPGFWDKTPPFFSYERRRCSTAYVPYNCGSAYVTGGLNGGTARAFLTMCRVLESRTEEDLHNGVIAIWHDESQLNRYVAERRDYRLLSPAYWYPEGWRMPFDPKIIVRNKARFIDVGAVKHQTIQPQSLPARKWEAFRQNYLPYLCCLRDTVLRRKLK